MSIAHRRVAEIGVHRKIIWVAFPLPGERTLVLSRRRAFWRLLQKMAARLEERAITGVAMESTSAAEIGQSTPAGPDRSYVIQVGYPDLRPGQLPLSRDVGV